MAKWDITLVLLELISKLMMHMDYKVNLMDHDFVFSPQLKLVPSI